MMKEVVVAPTAEGTLIEHSRVSFQWMALPTSPGLRAGLPAGSVPADISDARKATLVRYLCSSS